MSGSSLVAVIVPIVAFAGMAFWLGLVFHADSHPRRPRQPAGAGAAETHPAGLPAPRAAGAPPLQAPDIDKLTVGAAGRNPEQRDERVLAGHGR